ncbi:uncharacterized protein LOC118193265 isoform X2 [Stegodyphus dumicola]|uniref:uncharacterized protein LOC118193265 isoform X2 n=1 Tax=Stegodyphus dumicola TaxID=202533 RepID=UPI0015B220A2|nr:uncharacterized protein LOC118193265 isoform X2 [Stegodyphus dumicola]
MELQVHGKILALLQITFIMWVQELLSLHFLANFSHYKPGIFRHSDEEKTHYLQDFLKAIAVHQVDLLICHSSSIYPGLILCLDENGPNVKSLVMLNTGTYHLGMKYFKSMKMMVTATETPMGMKIMEICAPFIMKNIVKTPVKVENFLDPLLSATTMVHGNIPKAKEKFLQLVSRELPILYAFSEDDRLIGKKWSLELAYLLGAADSDIFQYDKDCNLKQRGNESSRLKVMSFERGSHYVFWKHPDIINNAIADFLFKDHLQK